ncbi:hypothetical protein BKA70DRAFT_1056446, partial [Coprinopsis sp. MPI-PUGE-AT-0042]
QRKHGLESDVDVLSHVKNTFPLHSAQEAFNQTHQHLLLQQPITGLGEPSASYRCTVCRLSWSGRRTTTATYTVQLWKHPNERYRVEMSTTTPPSLPPQLRTPAVTYTNDADFWSMSHLGERISPHILPLLDFEPSGEIWHQVSFVKATEQCLVRIRQLAKVYLSDAENRLETYPILRSALTRLR